MLEEMHFVGYNLFIVGCKPIFERSVPMRHIPNILTCLRILMVGVFIYFFIDTQYFICLITIMVAFLTDLLDGFLARRNNWISNLGKILDPFADKLFVITALACFYTRGWLPLFLLIIMAVKELAMVIGGLVLLKKEVVVYSDWFGKSAAGFFTAGVMLMFLRELYFPAIGIFALYVLITATVLSYIALYHYAMLNARPAKKEDSLQSKEEQL